MDAPPTQPNQQHGRDQRAELTEPTGRADPAARRRTRSVLAFVVALGVIAAGCTAGPPTTPTTTTTTTAVSPEGIQLLGAVVADGYRWELFRNLDQPCALSGHQTFVVGTRVGADPDRTGPLWVRMRGGGVGYFDRSGQPRPNGANMRENSGDTLVAFVTGSALARRFLTADPSARVLSVSMCSHDVYAGTGADDPYNPRVEPDGEPVTTNGLNSTLEAIDETTSRYPTSDVVLHGTSAGSAGSFHVAWFMERRGTPPAGVVADGGIINSSFQRAQTDQALACGTSEEQAELILARFDPLVADPANEPQLLVQRGELTVPLMHVWNQGDNNTCGDDPMVCPMPDGSSAVLWSTRCNNEPLRATIAALPPEDPSETLGVCVDDPTLPGPCDQHVVTTGGRPNEDPALPEDYVGYIVDWVQDRLSD